MSDAPIKLIVGLGNPGADYEATRHNVGFLTLDALASLLAGGELGGGSRERKASGKKLSSLFSRGTSSSSSGKPYSKLRCEALVSEIDVNGARLVLAKPQTYMNRSGRSIKGLLKHYGLHIEEVLVIHDDLDLPLGTLRIKQGGGHGGHNGLRSIIEACGSDFARVKVGIGRPPGQMPAERYVLQVLRSAALEELKVDAARAADSALLAFRDGIIAAQNAFNGA